MKTISSLFRIVAVATVLSLLVVALPATPALAAEDLRVKPSTVEIGERITVTGDGYDYDRQVYIFISSQELDEDDDIEDLDAYYRTSTYSGAQDDSDAREIDKSFNMPSRLTHGDDPDDDEDVHGGDYYAYTTYSRTGDIVAKDDFTVIAALIELDPEEGAVGTEVEITGVDFNDDEQIIVFWDGAEIDIESGDDETDSDGEFKFTIIIPESTAGEHTITVEDEDGAVAEFIFTVEAEITVDPTQGAPGDTVTVRGTGFGDEVEVDIEFDGAEVIRAETDDEGSFQAAFTVPAKSPGTYEIEAKDDDNNKDDVDFTVAAGINLGQTTGNVGSQVTITGAGFTPNASLTITYAGKQVATATADNVGKFSSTFAVPESQHGRQTITASDGTNTVNTTFTMESAPPPIPQPLLPEGEAKAKSTAYFDWDDVTDPSGVTYTLQIATNESFTDAWERTGLTESEYTLTKDEKMESTSLEAPYYWRVQAVDGASNVSGWTAPGTFYVGFTFELTGWVLYVLMGLAGLMILLIGFLLGRRSSYY